MSWRHFLAAWWPYWVLSVVITMTVEHAWPWQKRPALIRAAVLSFTLGLLFAWWIYR